MRVVVTAGNAGGSSKASSAATATVTATAPPAPTNTALPVVSGSAVEGQTLTATNGTWTGSPTSYTHQWEDCNSSGTSCTNVSGATGSTYKLAASDVGHTMRAVVTATNAGGSTAQASAQTAVVATEEGGNSFTCTRTLPPSDTTAVLDAAVEEAKGGETLCLETGNYTFGEMLGGAGEHLGRSSYVTIRAAKGAAPKVTGVRIRNTSYERWIHLQFTGGTEVEDSQSYEGSQYLEFDYDTWENTKLGLWFGFTGGEPTAGGVIRHVTIEHDYMYNMEIEQHENPTTHQEECKSGRGTGQDITLKNTEAAIKHNTFDYAEWHYIQYGDDTTVENNLFMGERRYGCSHLNVWQTLGGENDTFRNNIVIGKGTGTGTGPFGSGEEYASADLIEWENGPGDAHCEDTLTNMTVENNLFVDGGGNSEIGGVNGLTVSDNTIVNMKPGPFFVGFGPCPGKNYTTTHNIITGAGSFSFGKASGTNLVKDNVAWNKSATGGARFLNRWRPRWRSTASCPRLHAGCWNPFKEVEEGNHFPKPPHGYYVPTGLPFTAGYEGKIGP